MAEMAEIDITHAADAPVYHTLDGQQVALRRLRLRDLAALAAQLRNQQAEALRAACAAQAVPALEAACLVAQMAQRPIDFQALAAALATPEGVADIIALAAEHSPGLANTLLQRLPAGELRQLAGELSGLGTTCGRCHAAGSGGALAAGGSGPFGMAGNPPEH